MMIKPQQSLSCLCGLLAGFTLLTAQATQDADEAWLNGFGAPPEIGGEQLEFLAEPPDEPVHSHLNRIHISPSSLQDGWVRLEQCHRHLDAINRTVIVFRPDGIRNLEVTRFINMERAWAEGPNVFLRGVGKDALVCLTAESRALHAEDGGFILRNGPYHRQFLDGYYPMRVVMEVQWPGELLEFAGMNPPEQHGFALESGESSIRFDAWFSGKLSTEIHFLRRPGVQESAVFAERNRDDAR